MQSEYQTFKILWLGVIPLTKDAIHVYIGFLCLLVALVVLRRKLSSFWALAPGLAVAVTMEVLDLRDGFRWAESLKDFVNTNLIPFVLVLLARLKAFNS